jgi:glycine cleavage system transcriptional repressor
MPILSSVRHFALSAVGKDRPGIVAGVSEALLARGVNIEDSQMAILRGHFAMMLILAAPNDIEGGELRADLEEVGRRLALESVIVSEVADIDVHEPQPSHVVSVYGIDHPGIVHSVSAALAARQVTITDLRTQLVADPGAPPLYAMKIEVAAPPDASIDDALAPIGEAQGVEVTVRRIEADAL